MDKFSDDLRSAPPGTFKPTTVAGLLRKLELTDAPRDRQEKAIAKWLRSNKPSELMIQSLRLSDYSYLLNRATA